MEQQRSGFLTYVLACVCMSSVFVNHANAGQLQFNVPSLTIPDIGKSTRVCLQTWMGTYICAEAGGGGMVVCNRPTPLEWETFIMYRIDKEHVALKACNGQYLSAEDGGGTVVVANRPDVREWEKFALFIDRNGLMSFAAHNDQFLSADISGVIVARAQKALEWEKFRVIPADVANGEQTRIEVNVYKIGTAPIWHTGTVINGVEYYFDSDNRVKTCSPGRFNSKYHRTMVRIVPGNLARVKAIRDRVIAKWNGSRYNLYRNNCNYFTENLLRALGTTGLDQEYLNCSGLAKGVRQIPGSDSTYELIMVWPMKDKRLDETFMKDLKKLAHLPDDIVSELSRFGGKVSEQAKGAGRNISDQAKKLVRNISSKL